MTAKIPHNPDQVLYQIRLRGHLPPQWTDWFACATLMTETDGTTVLTCHLADQAALHGLLRQIRDLGIPLISVNRIDH